MPYIGCLLFALLGVIAVLALALIVIPAVNLAAITIPAWVFVVGGIAALAGVGIALVAI